MKYILLIETGTEVCSVAIAGDGAILSIRENHEGRMHAQNIAVYAEELLTELNIKCSDLSAVALSIGPGSYTGLRIGSSFAKGLCYSEGIPLIGISSLHSLVEGYISNHSQSDMVLAPMIDARRMEVFTQLFNDKGEAISEITAEIVDENSFSDYKESEIAIFGSGAEKCKDIINAKKVVYHDIKPSARYMARLAYECYKLEDFKDIAYFEPYYLKDFISTTKKRDILEKIIRDKTRK